MLDPYMCVRPQKHTPNDEGCWHDYIYTYKGPWKQERFPAAHGSLGGALDHGR